MSETTFIPTNEFQTPITQELIDSLEPWVREQFVDFVNNVPLVGWMISPDRPRAKDLPRDAEGKIIVDIAHPHILEDVDYFRPAARHFEEHGCYTFLKPNPNPKSEYGKWITEEAHRCREGYVRESDGEWIPGLMYWYLNYCRIKITKKNPVTGVSSQVPAFPLFWEGVYYRFHYIDQARKAHKHCIELARRGAGKSYSLAGIMSHNLTLGENEFSSTEVTSILAGYTKEYLSQKDGTLEKFVKMKDFVSVNTEFPRLLSTNRPSDMLWIAGTKDANGVASGSKNSVMGVAVKDDEAKVRGKRGFILFEEMGSFKNLLATYNNTRDSVKDGEEVFALIYLVGCVCAGTKVWLPDGRLINIEDLKQEYGIYGFDGEKSVAEKIEQLTTPKSKPCVEIVLQDKTSLQCSVDHPIYIQRRHQYAKYLGGYKYAKADTYFTYEWVAAGELKIGDRVCEARRIPAFGSDTLFDARLVGMLIGDGSYGYDNTPKYSSEDPELLNYVESRYETGLSASHITKTGNLYKDIRVKGICPYLREIGIYGQTHNAKRLPVNYQTLTQKDTALLLAGLYDTDGTVNLKDQRVELCQGNREILEQVSILLRKFGIFGTIREYKPRLGCGRKDRNPYYRLIVSGRVNMYYFQSNIPLLCKHKKKTLDEIVSYFNSTPSKREPRYDTSEIIVSAVKEVRSIGEKLVYNMTVAGSHTYIANNIITHNTAGDKDSDFSGAREILYNPEGYEIYPLENVYDLRGKGRKHFGFFFPSYMSRTGCMDRNGNSDVVKALISILKNRDNVRRTKPETLLSVIAQMPITPEEAILRVRKGYFPTDLLNERLRQIDQNPHFYDSFYIGTLVDTGGHVEFRRSDAHYPIREWPIRKNSNNNIDIHGALEVLKLPAPADEIPANRYVIGCLTPGQMVSTDSGLKKVEEVTLNDKLVNKEGELVSIKNLQRRQKVDEAVYNIKLWDNLDGVELTGNHPVFAATPKKRYHSWAVHLSSGAPSSYYEYEFDFKRADNLKVGDVVKCPIAYYDEKPVPLEKWTREKKRGLKYIDNPLNKWKFWWLMGLILGDGYCTERGAVYVVFNKKEQQYIQRFRDVVVEVFKRSPVVAHDRGNCIEYVFQCKQCAQFFTTWFGKYAQHKHISEWVKYIPKPLRLALITGYLDSDGCCCKNSMEFVSISKSLLLDIQDILLSLGVVSCVKKLRDATMHVIEGKMRLTKETYSLAIARPGVNKIGDLLGWKDIKLERFDRRNSIVRTNTRCWFSEDGRYVFYKIKEITTRQYSGIVYNFECDTHTYMCHHLPVHNCDPIENDEEAESESLFSFEVFDLFNDEPVAAYSGRMELNDDNCYLLWLACRFWNAKCMPEANKKNVYAYFAKKHSLYMLADCPPYLKERDVIKYSLTGSSSKGVQALPAVISLAQDFIKDYLSKEYVTQSEGENGELITTYIPGVYKLWERAMIQELLSYGPDSNTDRVSALMQIFLYRHQFQILFGEDGKGIAEEKSDTDDDFFNRDWEKVKDKVIHAPAFFTINKPFFKA